MNKKFLPLLVFSFSALMLTGQVNFQFASFEYTKTRAQKAKQPFFVYFASAACNTCEAMNSSTFGDPGLANMVNGKMGAYKVNIGAKNSLFWAEKFSVYNAPVFIFFDEQGNMVQRVEQPLTSTDLQRVLENPDAYHEIKEQFAVFEMDIEKPIAQLSNNVVEVEESSPVTTTTTSTSSTYVESEEIEPIGRGEYINITAQPTSSFSGREKSYAVQMGIFKEHQNAQTLAMDLQMKYDDYVYIMVEKSAGETFHRVLMGDYYDWASAKRVYKNMKEDGHSAFIKKK